ncbi:sigma-70 family RNA polymerase sigma factor [Actinomadura barringtoniae]|uniref:Sigma-70 family RNA polymerase sigma factor n=1 Tax=Actinomadura barringtoniae TaxID=1427535 RepID=A0A939PD86_9ACTN|nr:sigma-70 family RNA polymerase sigma factor [Actinomadura barringtoniae]
MTSLYEEHQVALIRLAVLLVGDEPTAENVVQDVFVRIRHKAPRLHDEARLLTHVRAAVLNGCRTELRRRERRWRPTEPDRPPVWSTESNAFLSQNDRELMRALQQLPRRQREALILRYYLGYSDAETAAAMGIRPGTVRSATTRALAALSTEMGGEVR